MGSDSAHVVLGSGGVGPGFQGQMCRSDGPRTLTLLNTLYCVLGPQQSPL